jgi:hypothetical protein
MKSDGVIMAVGGAAALVYAASSRDALAETAPDDEGRVGSVSEPLKQIWSRTPPIHADNGVRVDFFGESGVTYTFSHPALLPFLHAEADAKFVGDDFVVTDVLRQRVDPDGLRHAAEVVPRPAHYGCLVATPWIPIAQTTGVVWAYPHFKVEWNGLLLPQEGKTLVTFQMTIRHPNGTSSQTVRDISTDLLKREHIQSRLHSDWYGGELDNGAKEYGSAKVTEGDSVQFLVCDVQTRVTFALHDIVLKSMPDSP